MSGPSLSLSGEEILLYVVLARPREVTCQSIKLKYELFEFSIDLWLDLYIYWTLKLKYDKGDLVVMNREYIDPNNGFISEGTLLKSPRQSGWVDMQNFDATYEKIESTLSSNDYARELCFIFVEKLGLKCDALNEYVQDLRLMYHEAKKSGGKEFLDCLIRLKDFFYYFRKVLEADE